MSDKPIPQREPRADKVEVVEQVTEMLDRSAGFVVTDYRGLTVAEKSTLARRLREVDAEYHVVKNTLFKLAYAERGENPDALLKGPTAVVFAFDDPVAPAKAVIEFFEQAKKGEIKGGVVDGRIFNAQQITSLSKLPSKPELLAQVVGAIQGPLAGLVGTLQGIPVSLLGTLQAIHDQKAQA